MSILDGPPPKQNGLAVFCIRKPAVCAECAATIEEGEFLRSEEGKALCMNCADLGDLVYLPSGNMALTLRSRKYSTLSAIVLKWSRSRKRYERIGVLVEEPAYERAHEECLSDEDKRERAREKAAVKRSKDDQVYILKFTEAVKHAYPGCPVVEAEKIAEHACQKYSGRVGRSAMAKEFDSDAITLAVRAHIRHVHTDYDEFLASGRDRQSARSAVIRKVDDVEDTWRRKG